MSWKATTARPQEIDEMYGSSGFDENYFREKKTVAMVRNRLVIIVCAFIMMFLVVAGKAIDVMVIDGDVTKSKKNIVVSKISRAEIVDRNGVQLAINLKAANVYANPKELMDKKQIAAALTKIFPEVSERKLLKDLENKKAKFVWIKRNISPNEQKAVNNLGIPGLYFYEDYTRVYPQANLLAHILGYVDVDNHGLAGIEREFDELLSFDKAEPLRLSIDIKLQNILRDELAQIVVEREALGASGMIADVNTGEILAMVSLPDFDLNHPDTATSEQKFNRLTLGAYEVGSIFKPITFAMALDAGTATMDSTYDATNPIVIGNMKISDYHAKKRILTLPEVLMYSSNIGTAKIAMQAGTVREKQFLEKIGMFTKTEIEIPEKTKPLKPRNWKDVNTMTIAFGHGLAITPLHIARGFLPLVNGGVMPKLTLIKPDPNIAIEEKRIISKATSDKMRQLLRLVVTGGTGGKAAAEGYDVGGKTGTAEKITDGKYNENKLLSSFIGAFPMEKPKYVVLVMIDEPKPFANGARPTGGMIAAPIVKNVITRLSAMQGIEPKYTNKNSEINFITNQDEENETPPTAAD